MDNISTVKNPQQAVTILRKIKGISEEERLMNMAVKQYYKTYNTAYLGVCLNCTLALRVGEIVALKISDFSETTVHIQRQEVKHYEKSPDGKITRNGYEIVLYGKTLNADRKLYLTENAKILSNMGESNALSSEEIRIFAGHKDYTTTEKYYMHATSSLEKRSDAYEKAINSKIENVFKGVQTL